MIPFELDDRTVNLSLTFANLLKMETRHPKEYKLYFELSKKGIHTDVDAAKMVYVSYLCGNQDAMPDVLTMEEFFDHLKNGRNHIWEAYTSLMSDLKN